MLRSKANSRIDASRAAPKAWRSKLYRGIGLVIFIGLLFAGLISLGCWLRQQVRPLEQYSLPFDRIDCPDPPGRKHEEFLGEVRYLGELPSKLSIDENTTHRVALAFGKHPWVEKVLRVDLDPDRPRVRLVFRTPVLALAQVENGRMPVRVVDQNAILLPADAPGEGLPRYRVRNGTPTCSAGQRCLDPDIINAATTAAYLHDFLALWQIVSVQVKASGLSLTATDGTRIEWGHAPGGELATEAPAATKRDWLRIYFESRGTAFDKRSAAILDVRGPGEMTVQRIPAAGGAPR
jgi:hypothetical protein